MSIPLCALGGAILEVIGLNPQGYDYRSEANWTSDNVFETTPFHQPTSMGDRTLTLRLATRPHVMGGLDQYAIIRQHHENLDVVPYIRLTSGILGEVIGDVGIQSLSHSEEKIAPDGLGYRHEFEVELLLLGRHAGGGLWS